MAATEKQTLRVSLLGVALFATLSANAPAEPTSSLTPKARSEIAVYNDSNAVGVVTSAVSASIENPVSGWSADGSYLVDVVSAASVDIVSTASSRWTEVRQAGTLGASYKHDAITAKPSVAVSSEPDYLSLSGGARLTFDVADKMAMPTFGYAYTHDTAGRTGTPFSVLSLELARHTLSAGVELVVDSSTFLSLNADALIEHGDQSKPYRFLPVFSAEKAGGIQPGASLAVVNNARLPGRISEHTPESRYRFAGSARLAHRLGSSTFVLSERLYADDWGLKATTTDLKWLFDVGRRLEIWGHLRGHVQSSVDFWKVAYTAGLSGDALLQIPEYRTGDRELSALSMGTFGLGGRWKLAAASSRAQWSIGLQSDLLLTFFRDALYLRQRKGYLTTVDFQAEF